MRTRFSIHSGPPADAQSYKTLKWVLGDNLTLQAWRGKAKKPFANYIFRSDEARAEYLDRLKADEDGIEKIHSDRHAERAKALADMLAQIQVGTVLHYSWGYDQTNCEFFQVLGRFGKRGVVIQEIGHRVVEGSEGFMSDRVQPDKGRFTGEPMRKQIGPWGVPFDHGSATPIDSDEKVFYRSWYA